MGKLFGLDSLPLRTVIFRPIFVSIANSRLNRVYGWAGVGWLGAVLNSFSLIVWKTEDLRHCPRVSNVASAFGRNAWHFQVPEIPFSADLTKAKEISVCLCSCSKTDLIRAGFAYSPGKGMGQTNYPRGLDYGPLGKYFESFTLFFSVLFGSVIVDYVRANAHKTGEKMIPEFDMTLKTPYDVVNRQFEEQYNFVKFYGPMWIVFNWLLLLSCYIEVVLLVYIALKWANRRFERVKNLVDLIARLVCDLKVRASTWNPLQTQNNKGKAHRSTRLISFRVPVRVLIAISCTRYAVLVHRIRALVERQQDRLVDFCQRKIHFVLSRACSGTPAPQK